jgi:hypothetical protein
VLALGPSFAQNKIGVAAAVKNRHWQRDRQAGSEVRVREVAHWPDSMAQLLPDETSLSIGPTGSDARPLRL